jgi:redox-sensitive bicupin YhaK (pirin superfamily)
MKRRNFFSTFGLFFVSLPTLMYASLEIIRSQERHVIKKGWMDIRESFDYLNYDSTDEMGFGVLRKIDEFTMDYLTGTPIHPHKNMEILTILLEGKLFHEDTLGYCEMIKGGNIQLMSAGSGLKHAETNPSKFTKAKGFQIWLSCSNRDTVPTYQLRDYDEKYFTDTLSLVFSPDGRYESIRIQQDAYLYRVKSSKVLNYTCLISNQKNGFYFHVISGSLTYDNHHLMQGDGIGISDVEDISFSMEVNSDILLFDIPMRGDF